MSDVVEITDSHGEELTEELIQMEEN